MGSRAASARPGGLAVRLAGRAASVTVLVRRIFWSVSAGRELSRHFWCAVAGFVGPARKTNMSNAMQQAPGRTRTRRSERTGMPMPVLPITGFFRFHSYHYICRYRNSCRAAAAGPVLRCPLAGGKLPPPRRHVSYYDRPRHWPGAACDPTVTLA